MKYSGDNKNFEQALFEEHPSKREPEGYKIVSVRLREAEFEAFAQQVGATGLTHNMALRIVMRRIGGFLEIDVKTREVLESVLQSISNISRDIAQMHAECTQSSKADIVQFAKLRAAFGYEFARLDSTLLTILNIADRRLDGRTRLKDTVA